MICEVAPARIPTRRQLMTMTSNLVWRNGTMVSWPEATFHLSCHALHYGSGVFEGIWCYQTDHGPAVFRLGAHLDRFFASAKVYGIDLRYSRQDLACATLDLIWANEFTDCYIRPLAFYGSQTLSLHPHTCPVHIVILAWPWGDLARKHDSYAHAEPCKPSQGVAVQTPNPSGRVAPIGSQDSGNFGSHAPFRNGAAHPASLPESHTIADGASLPIEFAAHRGFGIVFS